MPAKECDVTMTAFDQVTGRGDGAAEIVDHDGRTTGVGAAVHQQDGRATGQTGGQVDGGGGFADAAFLTGDGE